MRILNLYAGIGGNRKLWGDEHEVVAVENDPYIAKVYSKMYPQDKVYVLDAHQFLLDNYKWFDLIWSSPPCPTHSKMRTSLVKSKPVYPDMDLYQEIIFLKHFAKSNWVVENVEPYYDYLIKPTVVLDRHAFWSNKDIDGFVGQRKFRGRVTDQTKETLADAYGIKLPEGTKYQRKLLRNAVDPRIGEQILNKIRRGSNG